MLQTKTKNKKIGTFFTQGFFIYYFYTTKNVFNETEKRKSFIFFNVHPQK